MSLFARIMARGEYPYRTRPAPPQPPKPEWERIAEEIIDARRPVGLDALVFGCWPGTYHPRPGD